MDKIVLKLSGQDTTVVSTFAALYPLLRTQYSVLVAQPVGWATGTGRVAGSILDLVYISLWLF
jgi:hypothetical protein